MTTQIRASARPQNTRSGAIATPGAEAYRNASPVRGQDGQILTMKEGENGTLVYNWDTADDGQESSPDKPFPKYDSEGYRYIYVVREYLTYEEGDYQYEQFSAPWTRTALSTTHWTKA